MIKLNESGLITHDLDYLVMPILDIDTFESKIDDNRAVVVAFYVVEQEPAKDLERFIEKSSLSIMDIESSPAPTEDGYYVVFVELDRNEKLPEAIIDIIEDVNNLTNIKKWQFKAYGSSEIHDLTLDNLKEFVNVHTTQADTDNEEIKESTAALFKNALIDRVMFENNIINFEGPATHLSYQIIASGSEMPSIPILALPIGHPQINESQKLSRALGPSYAVELVESGLLVQSQEGFIILQPVD